MERELTACFDKMKFANMNVHYFRYPFSFFLENQKALGIDHLVFWGSVPHLWVDQYGYEDIMEIKKMIEEHEIKVLAYAARPYNYSLFAPKGSLQRRCSESYYRFCIDIAQKLKTSRICIDLWGALRDEDPAGQYENCVEMLARLCAYAREGDCAVVAGNVPQSNSALMNTLDEVLRLKSDIRMNNLEIALDVCTALENGEDSKAWLNTFGEELSMIYLADGRSAGTGYPLGYGCYPVSKILRLLEERAYRGTVAIKMSREKNELAPTRADRANISYLKRHFSGCREN